MLVSKRINKRITDARLRREMNDSSRLRHGLYDCRHSISVRNVAVIERKTIMSFKLREPRLLQADVIVLIQIINASHVLTLLQ